LPRVPRSGGRGALGNHKGSEHKTGKIMTTYSDILTALANAGAPNATVGVDNDGQVVIFTNLTEAGETLVEMAEEN
jgi:hypothetical protein